MGEGFGWVGGWTDGWMWMDEKDKGIREVAILCSVILVVSLS